MFLPHLWGKNTLVPVSPQYDPPVVRRIKSPRGSKNFKKVSSRWLSLPRVIWQTWPGWRSAPCAVRPLSARKRMRPSGEPVAQTCFPVTVSASTTLSVNSAKGLVRRITRFFATAFLRHFGAKTLLRMTSDGREWFAEQAPRSHAAALAAAIAA